MLIKAKELKGYTLDSRDGPIGKVKEFYFDDQHWAIRYLVAETGNWMTDKQVLISPYALTNVNKDEERLVVDLTKKQIENSPSLDAHKPVSRQFEDAYSRYYQWPNYCGGPYMWGATAYIERNRQKWRELEATREQKAWDPHLRSTKDVSGHHLQAIDGEIGHVEDFVIDDQAWAIRYFLINTSNWWAGKTVLISPQWIKSVSWSESKVFVDLSRATIKNAPEYTEHSRLTRDYETGLFQHYDRHGYWVDEPVVEVLVGHRAGRK